MQDDIEIKIFPTGDLDCNSVIMYNKKSKKGLVIDPGEDLNYILQKINDLDVCIEIILHTHGHLDHIACSQDLKAKINKPIYLHEDDKELYQNLPLQGLMLGKNVEKPVADADIYFTEKDVIEVEGISLEVIHTPGHSQGSCCFLFKQNDQQILFSGDTLFKQGIGRTDLPGGNFESIVSSLNEKLFKMDDNIKVIPGHGFFTTIGAEKRNKMIY